MSGSNSDFNDYFNEMNNIILVLLMKSKEQQNNKLVSGIEFINEEYCEKEKSDLISPETKRKLINGEVGSYFCFGLNFSEDKEFFDALRYNFQNYTSLYSLNFNSNFLTTEKIIPLVDIFKNCFINIQYLDLSYNEIDNIDNLIYSLMNNSTLNYLNLSNNNIKDINILCEYLSKNNSLKTLNLSHNSIHNFDDFENVFSHNTTLKELNIGNQNNIKNPINITKFCNGLNNNNSLGVLYMCGLELTDINPLFDNLKNNSSLSILNLYDNNISNIDCLEEFFKTNKSLSKLSLSYNKIHNITPLCNGLNYNEHLYYLDIRENNDIPIQQTNQFETVLKNNICLVELHY